MSLTLQPKVGASNLKGSIRQSAWKVGASGAGSLVSSVGIACAVGNESHHVGLETTIGLVKEAFFGCLKMIQAVLVV